MVAVTGATGLLGGHLVEKLVAENVSVVALHRPGQKAHFPSGVITREADITDSASLKEAFEGVTAVIHAAAFVSFNPRWRKKILDVNVGGTRHVVDACLDLGIRNLIHISSVAALGRKPGLPITEESKWTGLLSSDYAESKYMAELEVFRGAEEGLTVGLVNPSVILSAARLGRSSAELFTYVWNEKRFYTDRSLNFVDARDVTDVVYQLYREPRPGEKFILSGGSVAYREFFGAVAAQLGKRAPSIRIGPALSQMGGWLEETRGWLFNAEPLVTRQSATMALQSFQYDTKKVRETMGMQFRPLANTLEWCCRDYLQNVKVNN